MPLEPSINLGDISSDETKLLEFRDSLQILLDELFEKGHEEPNSNAFIATRASAQTSIAGSTPTKIIFDLLREGDDGEFDTAVGRFIPTVPGTYDIKAVVELPNLPGANLMSVSIYKNNVEIWKGNESPVCAVVNGLVVIEEGDFIEIYVTHNNGSAEDTTSVQSRIKFAGYKIP